MAHDDMRDAVLNRLAIFRSSGDRRVITDPQAAEEVAALRASIDWPPFGKPPSGAALRRELDVAVLAGMIQFIRSQELPPGDRVDARLQATEIFTAVYPLESAMVPEPIRAMCGALAGDPPDIHHAALHNEAIDMLDAAEVTRDRATLDQAIWLLAAAFLAAPQDDDRARHLSVLGTAWLDRFWSTGRPADLDNAVAAHRRALALGVGDPADQAGHQANLSAALRARYENTGGIPDLDEAVETARAAADIARAASGQGHAAWPRGDGQDPAMAIRHATRTSESGLGAALLRRYLHSRAPADLDEAIAAGRNAVSAAPVGDPSRPGMQANLANLLLERFTCSWRLADLTEAVTSAQAAADTAASRDPARAVALSALALAHGSSFAYSGNLDDLDLAISVGREAVAATGDSHPIAATCLSNLGGALRTRYQRTGDTEALEEAIVVLRQAVHAAPAGHASMPGFLNNLGNALRSCFEASAAAAYPAAADPAVLRESVALLTRAVAAAPPAAPDRAGYLANLANALILAAEYDAYPGALDQAIGTLEREIGTVGDDHPLRHTFLVSLGRAWLARFDASGDDRALEAAIGYLGRAAKAVPDEHPHRAENLAQLGDALLRKAERPGDTSGAVDRAAARDAITASKAAADISTAPAMIRAQAARDWGQAAALTGDVAEAVNGFSAAVTLLDRVALKGLQRGDQERNLGRFAALACDAAAWAIQAGKPERAVELLEQGRGILLAQALDQRARYHDLRRVAPDLADRLAYLDDTLEHLPPADDPLRAADAVLGRRRQDHADEREAVLARIRTRPGFADFLKPPTFSTLRQAASHGPVVIVNVSGYRCDALIVTTGGVQVIPLTGLTGADVVTSMAAFMVNLREGETIAGTLAWLWDTVAGPLMPVLEAACAGPAYAGQAGPRPRIWWCPTGPLTFVPLHAAGRHDQAGGSVLDHFVSSYTPTLRLLIQARDPAPGRDGDGRPLVVALPHTPGQPALPGADIEADDFIRQFSPADELRRADATVEAVGRALGQSPPLAHFACHGTQDVTDPSSGHLLLHDGSLGITRIAGLRLDSAELAFLSACETVTGGIQLSDEVITLAAAFRLAGYRHVIGTLWTISDTHAPDIARQVYERLKVSGPDGAAVALDVAIGGLRARRRTNPWLWASYIHIGP